MWSIIVNINDLNLYFWIVVVKGVIKCVFMVYFVFLFGFFSLGFVRVILYFFLILDRVYFIKYDLMCRWILNGDKLKKIEIKLLYLIKFDECVYILY